MRIAVGIEVGILNAGKVLAERDEEGGELGVMVISAEGRKVGFVGVFVGCDVG